VNRTPVHCIVCRGRLRNMRQVSAVCTRVLCVCVCVCLGVILTADCSAERTADCNPFAIKQSHSVPRSKHSMSVTKTNQLLLYRDIAVCSQSHSKHTNTLCGQNVGFVNVKLAVHLVTSGLKALVCSILLWYSMSVRLIAMRLGMSKCRWARDAVS
jgi:hypothetical protein